MLRRRLLALPLAALAGCGRPAEATAEPEPLLPLTGEGRVASVIDGSTLALDTGLEVRLAGLLPPLRASRRASAEPHAEASRAALEDLTLGRRVRLETPPGLPPRDRWSRAVARLTLPDEDGLSVARALVGQGTVRVRPEGETDEEARVLLALEAEARAAGAGLWESPYFAVRPAEAIGLASQGSFQIVEGVVVDAATTRRGWIYLNFGPDYRTDFTAGAPPETSKLFDAAEMLALPAAVVRVRGEIESYNGPFIRLVAPAQVERVT